MLLRISFMSISKNVKWILIIVLSVFIFTYSRQFMVRGRNPPTQRKHSTCEKGQKCSIPFLKTTKPTAVKPVKAKPKKVPKIPYLEQIHLLPKPAKQETQEIVALSNQNTSFRRKLLIFSYFDWGVPSIGDILSQHPGVFYFNDPLRPFDSTTLKDGEEPISRRLVTEAAEYLEDLLECRILGPGMGFSDKAIKKMAKRAYEDCSASTVNITECIQESCKRSKIIVSKTIRLYVQDVKDILSRSKGQLKVILLQKDPRANLNLRNQRMKQGWVSGSDMFFQGRSLCSRMLHDVQESKRLEGSSFKDFYRIVLFEHFLKAPETVLQGLFTFLGVATGSDDIRRTLKVSGGFKQVRRALLNKWDWLPEEDACINIDKACSFFYKNSLYSPLKQSNGYLQRYNLCKYCD